MIDAGFIHQKYLCQDLLQTNFTTPEEIGRFWCWKWVNARVMPLSFWFITGVVWMDMQHSC